LQAAGVVGGDQLDRFAQHTASLVQIRNRHLHGNTVALPGLSEGSAERMGEANRNLRRGVRRRGGRQRHAE